MSRLAKKYKFVATLSIDIVGRLDFVIYLFLIYLKVFKEIGIC